MRIDPGVLAPRVPMGSNQLLQRGPHRGRPHQSDTGVPAQVDPARIPRRLLDFDEADDSTIRPLNQLAVTQSLSERQPKLLLLVGRRSGLHLHDDDWWLPALAL